MALAFGSSSVGEIWHWHSDGSSCGVVDYDIGIYEEVDVVYLRCDTGILKEIFLV